MSSLKWTFVLIPVLALAVVPGCKSKAQPVPSPSYEAPVAAAPAASREPGVSCLRAANDFYNTLMLYKTDIKERDIEKCNRHTIELRRSVTELLTVHAHWLPDQKRLAFERSRAKLPPLVAEMQNALAMKNLVFAKAILDHMEKAHAAMEEKLN